MNKSRWMIVGLVFLLVLPVSMPAFGWDKIIAFGDSLSDNGPADGYGFCVASNGYVWLDYLAASMRDVELEDRALCGARTDGPLIEDPNGNDINIGMNQQVSYYIDSLPADADLSGILFTVWIGGNDFLANPTNPFSIIDTAINRIEASIQDLIDAGAEDILVMNMPDLGLAPGIVFQDYIYGANGALIAAYTYASEQFNESLTATVCTLREENKDKNIKFYIADTFKLLQYAVENGESLGFTNVDGTCVSNRALPYCEGYIFFDDIHPTTATHKYLAALALGQVKHGRISKEMKDMLKELNPIHPRMPFVVNCFE